VFFRNLVEKEMLELESKDNNNEKLNESANKPTEGHWDEYAFKMLAVVCCVMTLGRLSG
jgi:hypothetical protein